MKPFTLTAYSCLALFFTAFLFAFYPAKNDPVPVIETGSRQPMPNEWIDKDTRHKIIKLSRRDGDSRSFYFHNNPFISQSEEEGDLMVFYGEVNGQMQLFTQNLKTLDITQLTRHGSRIHGEIVAPKRREVFYQSRDSVYAVHVDTRKSRLVFVFPEDFQAGVTTLNADETLLAGSYADPVKDEIYRNNPDKSDYFTLIYEAKIPHTLFTLNLETGELNKIYRERAWLNHIQFSPTDPDLLMYDHEGPWHLVDRIWLIDVKSGKNRLMHKREMDMEIAGHEFFSRDGDIIWFDLQKPRGKTFFLAGKNIHTGALSLYEMDRDEWSIHFNQSPDQTLFAGDGGDPTQVARAENGQWIYLFTARGDRLESKKLVNMQHHGYRPLEPNVHFSPDGKWVIFRSDLDGEVNIYAVEVARLR